METLIVQTDVSKLTDVENLVERSHKAFGTVDLHEKCVDCAYAVPVRIGNTSHKNDC